MIPKRRKSGRWRIAKGNAGEREVLDLLSKAGWIVMNGAMAENGVDLIAYSPWERTDPNDYSKPEAWIVLHAEAKNERWDRRGRSYLVPVAARWEARGILYRVFTKERSGWTVRAIRGENGQARTVYKAPATLPNLTVGGLLMGCATAPPTPAPEEE